MYTVLKVDTADFNDKTWLTGAGAAHTDKLHVIKRFRRPDLGHLEVDITMEDPERLQNRSLSRELTSSALLGKSMSIPCLSPWVS